MGKDFLTSVSGSKGRELSLTVLLASVGREFLTTCREGAPDEAGDPGRTDSWNPHLRGGRVSRQMPEKGSMENCHLGAEPVTGEGTTQDWGKKTPKRAEGIV